MIKISKLVLVILFFFILFDGMAQNELYPGIVKLKTGAVMYKTYKPKTPKLATQDSLHSVGFFSIKFNKAPIEDYSKWRSDTIKYAFYAQPKIENVPKQISLYYDWSRIPIKEKTVEQDFKSWFSPMSFINDTSGGYYSVLLVCKSMKGKWLEVVINEKTQETLWIRRSKYVQFIKWKSVPKKLGTLLVYKQRSKANKLHVKPDTSSNEIQYVGRDCFEIEKVKGNWMQISNKYSEWCGVDYEEEPFVERVWLQFKLNDNLLINFKIP